LPPWLQQRRFIRGGKIFERARAPRISWFVVGGRHSESDQTTKACRETLEAQVPAA
jgi:hypothetical protein